MEVTNTPPKSAVILDLIQCLEQTAKMFEEDDEAGIAKLVGNSNPRLVAGVCLMVRNLQLWHDTSDLLCETFKNLYGSSSDPFKKFGSSYLRYELDWHFRAQKCKEMITHLEKELDKAEKEEENQASPKEASQREAS